MSVIYIMGYNGMVATYAWLAGGEIPSQRLRSYTFGIAAAVGFLGAWLATFTAPYFINPDSLNWGPQYGQSFPSVLSLLARLLTTNRVHLGTVLSHHGRLDLFLPS